MIIDSLGVRFAILQAGEKQAVRRTALRPLDMRRTYGSGFVFHRRMSRCLFNHFRLADGREQPREGSRCRGFGRRGRVATRNFWRPVRVALAEGTAAPGGTPLKPLAAGRAVAHSQWLNPGTATAGNPAMHAGTV